MPRKKITIASKVESLSILDEKGQLDQALMEVSELYEAELERGVGRMAFWVEILATAVIALFVVFRKK